MRRIRHNAVLSVLGSGVLITVLACGETSRSPSQNQASASTGSPQPPSATNAARSVEPIPSSSPGSSPPAASAAYVRVPSASVVDASLDASRDAIVVRGAVTADGAPIAGAQLKLSAIAVDGRPQTVQIKGIVPAGARTAHVGIRVNTEGVESRGPARIWIYGASFVQSGSARNRVPNPDLRFNANFWGLHEDGIRVVTSDIGPGLMIRIVDRASQETIINTGGFRVAPGKPFRATMRLRFTAATVGHAYFTVTWLSSVSEIARERLDLVPAPIRAPTMVATASGAFRGIVRDLEPGRYRIRIEFAGNDSILPAAWEKSISVS